MFNYLAAEFWRTFRRTSIKVLLIPAMLLPILLNVLAINDQFTQDDTLILSHLFMPPVGLLFILLITDIVFADELRLGTLKNSVAAGVSRTQIYFGKLLTVIFFCLLYLLAALGCFFLSIQLLPKAESFLHLRSFFYRLGGILPLWLAAAAFLTTIFFAFRHGVTASIIAGFVMFLLMIVPEKVREAVLYVHPLYLLMHIGWDFAPEASHQLCQNCIVGAGWLILSILAGWTVTSRREIS